MRLILVSALLVALTATLTAETRRVSRIDDQGRTYTAAIIINEATDHVTSITGKNFEGNAWSFELTPVTVSDLSGLRGITIHMISAQGFWFYVFMDSDGLPSGVGRYGEPGTLCVYKLRESSKLEPAENPPPPRYR